jgi:hypothetical protein
MGNSPGDEDRVKCVSANQHLAPDHQTRRQTTRLLVRERETISRKVSQVVDFFFTVALARHRIFPKEMHKRLTFSDHFALISEQTQIPYENSLCFE